MITGDYNHDGYKDVLMVGNMYATEVNTGRYDASLGLYLQGDGHGNFYPSKAIDCGFFADGDAKGMAKLIKDDGRILLIVGNNSGPIKAYAVNEKYKSYQAQQDDAFAVLTLRNGKSYKHEFFYGSTYLSQSSRSLPSSSDVVKIEVFNFKGELREVLLQ